MGGNYHIFQTGYQPTFSITKVNSQITRLDGKKGQSRAYGDPKMGKIKINTPLWQPDTMLTKNLNYTLKRESVTRYEPTVPNTNVKSKFNIET